METTIPTAPERHLPGLPPAPLDPLLLRQAFGQFATGVAVVTARANDGRRLGITINSLASVSLQPALLLWSLRRASRDHAAFTGAGHFVVHVLGRDQAALCERFQWSERDRFADLDCLHGHHGAPLLDGCLARFECRLHQVVAAGDHSILIGEVLALEQHAGEPLMFHHGRFGGFASG